MYDDQIGNPLNDGEWTYTWQNGRQLARMQKDGMDASYVYNENGLRVQKTVNGVVTNYTLHGKNVVHMTQGNDELHFYYDASNKPAVMVYNGVPYSYVKNLQGDIVAILDANGAVVVSYVYDAWGRPISKTGSMAATLGTVQPFRYRGYVYDEEMELFYLGSRYYSPINCRFFNADAILLISDLVMSNPYGYCAANPITFCDNSGYAMVRCFDENGYECTFMSMAMGGCCGGGNGAAIGYATIEIVKDMDQEDWIKEGITIAVIALSLASTSVIMSGAHLLGKAFFVQATASATATAIDFGIGCFLYGETVAGGLFLSYVAEDVINHVFGQEYAPPEPEDVAVDFILEWVPLDLPMVADFFFTYVEESFDPIPPTK